MEKKKLLPKWYPIAVLVAVIIAFLVAYFILLPKPSQGTKHITVTVTHLDQSVRTFEYRTDAEYLRQVLADEQQLVSGSEEEYGLWIKTVDGETANEANQEWWGYNVNGEMAMFGVEQMPVNDGDVIDFTLNVGF